MGAPLASPLSAKVQALVADALQLRDMTHGDFQAAALTAIATHGPAPELLATLADQDRFDRGRDAA